MEMISLKLESEMLKEIDNKLKKHRYSTRTEFIRDAIRHTLTQLEKDELLRAAAQGQGSTKRKTTDEQLHKAREKLTKIYEEKFK